jgi:3',5'-cyclic AMP phosphodiesterase CpdA
MRTLVHLSDLHFGRLDYATIEPLARLITELEPDVVAVSGDLTQRARIAEFEAARDFLDRLPSPQIIVPGNHDVPLHNPYRRFVRGLARFRAHITDELEPTYADGELAIIGVNTARSLTIMGGRMSALQVARVRQWLCPFHDDIVKIIVTHHPFELPEGRHRRWLIQRARTTMKRLAHCGADVFLSGHLHLHLVRHTAVRYRVPGLSALIVQAGTATSTRGRYEANSFNVLRIEHPNITVERHLWRREAGRFAVDTVERFVHCGEGWDRVSP